MDQDRAGLHVADVLEHGSSDRGYGRDRADIVEASSSNSVRRDHEAARDFFGTIARSQAPLEDACRVLAASRSER